MNPYRLTMVFFLGLTTAACSLNPQQTPSAVSATSAPSPTEPSTPSVTPSAVVRYELISGDCRLESCLFRTETESDYPIGIATIKGYYLQTKRTAFGETKLCDSLVIVDGSQELIQSFISLVDKGNTVNSKNASNQPVINLNLDTLNAPERQNVLASTADQPIELLVLMPRPGHRGVPACFSPVTILKVR